MMVTSVMKSVVLKGTQAVGLHEEAGTPSGLIWEEVIRTGHLN